MNRLDQKIIDNLQSRIKRIEENLYLETMELVPCEHCDGGFIREDCGRIGFQRVCEFCGGTGYIDPINPFSYVIELMKRIADEL